MRALSGLFIRVTSAHMLPRQHAYYISGLFSSVSLVSPLASARMLPQLTGEGQHVCTV